MTLNFQTAPLKEGLHIDFANAEMCPVPGSKNRKPNPSTLEVEFKRARLSMRGEGMAVFVMPVIALIYSAGLAGSFAGLAWLVSEIRAIFS